MGGFTSIQLADVSQENIDAQNKKLREFGVPKHFKFYSENDAREEYEYYKKGDGNYPDDLFPKHKINSYEDFRRYWNPKALGEVFVPHVGMLTLDCYFGRTSKRALRNIGKYVIDALLNGVQIKKIDGSALTFSERAFTRLERQLLTERKLI